LSALTSRRGASQRNRDASDNSRRAPTPTPRRPQENARPTKARRAKARPEPAARRPTPPRAGRDRLRGPSHLGERRRNDPPLVRDGGRPGSVRLATTNGRVAEADGLARYLFSRPPALRFSRVSSVDSVAMSSVEVIINAAAGAGAQNGVVRAVEDAFAACGVEARVAVARDGEELTEMARRAVSN